MPTRHAARHRTLVVGAGAAGVPLAARLSQDADREVILCEAGSAGPTPPELLNGGMLVGAMPQYGANWAYSGALTPQRSTSVARGRILGGSTALNGGYFVRASPADFARWASVAGPEWSFDQVLPVLKALENDLDYGATDLHGAQGPVRVSRPPQTAPATAAFSAAAQALGFALEADKNAGAQPGVGPVPSNIVDGTRINTGISYLGPDQSAAPQLQVLGDTRVLRVIIEPDVSATSQPRVVGALTTAGFIEADEVVLAAGAIATPQILMLSGVGPRDQLEALGIHVHADLPVGRSFSDHPNLALEWRTQAPIAEWDAGYGFPTALNFDSSSVDPSLPTQPEGDLELLLTAKPLEYLLTGERPAVETLQLLVALQHTVGRGRLSLQSADPDTPPSIDYHYLEESIDRQRFRAGVRTAAQLLRSPEFAHVFGGFTDLADGELKRDTALDEWILAHLGTALHTCSTAPIGPVVNAAGKVHGIRGLRVADTSILPSAPHRGPANTAVFIGEFIARQMLAGR